MVLKWMMTKEEILSVKVHRHWDSTVRIICHMHNLTCIACGTSLFNAKQVAILTHLAACDHQTAVTHCLPCEVFLCQPVPEHPVCSTCTHRHILSTEVTFYGSSSCNSTVHLFTNTVTWNGQMVHPSDSNCWIAFIFYCRPLTHSLVLTSPNN
jgi:hypothetical protein